MQKMGLLLRFVLILLGGYFVQAQRQRPPQRPPQQPPPQQPPPPPAEEEPDKDPCRHTSYEPKGTFESPNYPEYYPNQADCLYRIFTDKIVNVNFEAFGIEETRDCTYDYLQIIFDATSPDASPERYCGEGLGKIEGGRLRGKGPLIMAFRSDDSEARGGFKFSYEFELEGPDPCDSDPCQHGGTCQRLVGYYKCTCVDGYVGTNCEENRDDCASYPCEHGGQCQDGLNNYTCDCINGFTGTICEIDPDPCASNPCQNGGLCVNRIPDFVCSCPRTFMGDMCEEEVPTLPPPTTTANPESPDEEPDPEEDDNNDDKDDEEPDEEEEKGGGGGEDDTTPVELDEPGNGDVHEGNDDGQQQAGDRKGNRDGLIAAVVVILLVALILALLFAWCWFKHQRKSNKNQLEKEVTLINLKTKSEHGKQGKESSRTTSLNVLNSKNSGKQNEFLNEFQKMSQDIIMEEVGGEEGNESWRTNHFDRRDRTFPNPPRVAPSDAIEERRNPSTKHDWQNKMAGLNAPLQLSPEDAVSLLTYLKSSGNKKCDVPTALQNVQQMHEIPRKTHFTPIQNMSPPRRDNSKRRNFHRSTTFDDGVSEHIDLTPHEAAEVVNGLLQRPPRNGPLKAEEARALMRDIRDRRFMRENYKKEETVILNPEEVANVVNGFNEHGLRNRKRDTRNGANYRPQNFRRYTPITEEDSTIQADESQRNERFSDSMSEIYTEPSIPRKRIAYANTIDPDEKVNDWLKSEQKRKKLRRHYSPANSVATETHTVTRAFPSAQKNKKKKTHRGRLDRDITMTDYDYDGRNNNEVSPRTIHQTRVRMTNPNKGRNSLPVTENKAKSLVEKLIKPPIRSNQNVVGPSLGVKRQNAFLS